MYSTACAALQTLRDLGEKAASYESMLYQELNEMQERLSRKYGLNIDTPECKTTERTPKVQSKKRKHPEDKLTIVVSKNGDIAITTAQAKSKERPQRIPQEKSKPDAAKFPKGSGVRDVDMKPKTECSLKESEETLTLVLSKDGAATMATNSKDKENLLKDLLEKTKKDGERFKVAEVAQTNEPKLEGKQEAKVGVDDIEAAVSEALKTLKKIQVKTKEEAEALKIVGKAETDTSKANQSRQAEQVLMKLNIEEATSTLLEKLRKKAKEEARVKKGDEPEESSAERQTKKLTKKRKQKAKKKPKVGESSQSETEPAADEVSQVWGDLDGAYFSRKPDLLDMYEKKACLEHELRLARSLNFNMENTLAMMKLRLASLEDLVASARARICLRPGCVYVCHHHCCK